MRSRHLAIFACVVALSSPAWAQSRPSPPAVFPIPPPNAGTQVLCCSGYTVTARYGWPSPALPGFRAVDHNIPDSWAVVTIVAVPNAPTGNTYGLRAPGHAVDLRVWDPSDGIVEAQGTTYRLGRVQPIVVGPIDLPQVNAIGGTFPAQGYISVVYARHLPDVFQVAVRNAEDNKSFRFTLRRADIF